MINGDSLDVAGVTYANKQHRKRNEDSGLAAIITRHSVEFVSPVELDGSAPLACHEDIRANKRNGSSDNARYVGLCVSDGIGGAPHGDLASNSVVNTFGLAAMDYGFGSQPYRGFLQYAFRDMILEFEDRFENVDPAASVVMAGVDRRKNLYVGWVGDSRAYLVRDDEVYLLTRDHNKLRRKLSRSQLVCPGDYDRDDFSDGGMYRFLDKDSPPTWLDKKVFELEDPKVKAGDVLVLMTDGAYEAYRGKFLFMHRRKKLLKYARVGSASDIARELVDHSIQCGSTDNATVMVAKF